jgi:hypothetical protein
MWADRSAADGKLRQVRQVRQVSFTDLDDVGEVALLGWRQNMP